MTMTTTTMATARRATKSTIMVTARRATTTGYDDDNDDGNDDGNDDDDDDEDDDTEDDEIGKRNLSCLRILALISLEREISF